MRKLIKKLIKYSGFEIIRRRHAQVDFSSLLSLFFYKKQEDFFFVQIGANDGRKTDPIYNFVSKYNFSGLLVEPQKNAFENLRQNYKDNDNLIFENVAISDKDGHRPIYAIKRSFQGVFEKHTGGNPTGISSFDKEHVGKYLKRGMGDYFKDKQVEDYVDEMQVQTVTFGTLMRKHNIKAIDLLQIDTEGFDFEIIKMIDFDEYPPKLINYESAHLSVKDRADCEILLRNKGYQLLRNREDTCAIRG